MHEHQANGRSRLGTGSSKFFGGLASGLGETEKLLLNDSFTFISVIAAAFKRPLHGTCVMSLSLRANIMAPQNFSLNGELSAEEG